jgi:O-antigen/teichoic acid export membrane protein
MLSLMKGDAAVGLYSAAYQLINALGFIPVAFTAALLPVLSRLHITGQDSLRFAYQKSFKYLLLVALPIAVATTLVADRIILGIYSSGFSEAAHLGDPLQLYQLAAGDNSGINKQAGPDNQGCLALHGAQCHREPVVDTEI